MSRIGSRNRTLTLSDGERRKLSKSVVFQRDLKFDDIENRVICGDSNDVLKNLGLSRVDLLFTDPPYNLTKTFGDREFRKGSPESYEAWLRTWLQLCVPLLKTSASIYVCGDWRSGSAIERALSEFSSIRNRITWEREKGRGAKQNWKVAAEDIWYSTISNRFTFNTEAVKQRRRVIAPYKKDGQPKDWNVTETGNFRDTHPSNLWTDITVPFWSMPENTDHPTQKPEKLLAKIILASTDEGDLILDPFAGSGSTAVVAKKLNRRFIAIESNLEYCLLAAKRLELAETDKSIQGFVDGVFWERNSAPIKSGRKIKPTKS